MVLEKFPFTFRSRDIRRSRDVLFESFDPIFRFRAPTDLFNEIVPPNAVTRRRIVDPRRAQLRLDLDPFFSARRFGCYFLFWCELTRTDRLYNSTRSLPRDVDPTGLKLEGAQTFLHRLGLALVMMRCCLRARACFI